MPRGQTGSLPDLPASASGKGGAGAGSASRPPVLRRAPACERGPGSGVSGELGVRVAVRVLWPFRRSLRRVPCALFFCLPRSALLP